MANARRPMALLSVAHTKSDAPFAKEGHHLGALGWIGFLGTVAILMAVRGWGRSPLAVNHLTATAALEWIGRAAIVAVYLAIAAVGALFGALGAILPGLAAFALVWYMLRHR